MNKEVRLPDGRSARFVPADEAGEFRLAVDDRFDKLDGPLRAAVDRLLSDWHASGLGHVPGSSFQRSGLARWETDIIHHPEAFDQFQDAMRCLTAHQRDVVRRMVLDEGPIHWRSLQRALVPLAEHYGYVARKFAGRPSIYSATPGSR